MKACVFQAALLCEACAKDVMAYTKPPVGVDPANLDESLYDSDDYPKGPYPQGGGEADTPQHCDHCGVFLENPLTRDGVVYTADAIRAFDQEGDGAADVIAIWRQFYHDSVAEYNESLWKE